MSAQACFSRRSRGVRRVLRFPISLSVSLVPDRGEYFWERRHRSEHRDFHNPLRATSLELPLRSGRYAGAERNRCRWFFRASACEKTTERKMAFKFIGEGSRD